MILYFEQILATNLYKSTFFFISPESSPDKSLNLVLIQKEEWRYYEPEFNEVVNDVDINEGIVFDLIKYIDISKSSGFDNTMNSKKTKIVVFGTRNKANKIYNINIKVNGEIFQTVPTYKYILFNR